MSINYNGNSVPFAKGISNGAKPPKFKSISVSFAGSLRPAQKKLCNEAIGFLKKTNSVIISAYPGFGKTISALYIASQLHIKTLVVASRKFLLTQWFESISKFCSMDSLTISYINQNNSKNDEIGFGLVTIQSLSKLDKDFLKSFGLIILDEVHLLISSIQYRRSLSLLYPQFIIALSATAWLESNSENYYFADFFGTNCIVRELYSIHNVYPVFTEINIFSQAGAGSWSKVLLDQSLKGTRNKFIVKTALELVKSKRTVLILTKLKNHVDALSSMFPKSSLVVDTFSGNKNSFNPDCNILIGTTSKIGTGFDFDKLDALILASDIVAKYIQQLGRVMRKPTNQPIIIDIVDSNPILESHFNERFIIYQRHGANIYTRSNLSTFSLKKNNSIQFTPGEKPIETNICQHSKELGRQKMRLKRSPKKSSPKGSSPKRSSPKRSSPKRSSPKRSSPKRSSPKRSSPKRSSPKRSSPKRSSPKRSSPKRKSSPKRSSPKRSSPKRSSPKRSSPKRSSPKRSSPKRSSPKRSSPKRKSSPKK